MQCRLESTCIGEVKTAKKVSRSAGPRCRISWYTGRTRLAQFTWASSSSTADILEEEEQVLVKDFFSSQCLYMLMFDRDRL